MADFIRVNTPDGIFDHQPDPGCDAQFRIDMPSILNVISVPDPEQAKTGITSRIIRTYAPHAWNWFEFHPITSDA